MKKMFKLISMLLSVVMIMGAVIALFTVETLAADTVTTGAVALSDDSSTGSIDYMTQYFATPEEKLATMTVAYEKDGVRIYVDKNSGEVAYVNTLTGEKLFTNPYDVAASTGNDATKYEILSQIIVTFTDSEGQERIFTSYEEAAERGQIVVENIKGGIRVEYTIGREQSKVLVPRLISMDRFEEMILAPLYEKFGDELFDPRTKNSQIFEVQKMLSYYMLYSVDKLNISAKDRTNMENTYGGIYDNLIASDAQYARALKKFPIVETMPVYVFDPDASEKELAAAEEVITEHCTNYTYEELEYDHILTEYKADDSSPPVFRMALEYKADANGLSVRLPANGIRFNESLYTLENIEVLPYMGAGSCAYEGYNFFPDGSGTLFDFQDLNTNQTRAVSGKVYGTDFAYHEITGTYQKTIRYPVFGIVEEAVYYEYQQFDKRTNNLKYESRIAGNIVEAIQATLDGESVSFCNGQAENLYKVFHRDGRQDLLNELNSNESLEEIITEEDLIAMYGNTYIPTYMDGRVEWTRTVEKRGFVCIIEEGDALASITTYHAGALSDYNTMKMQFTPRPKDSYNIADSISVSENSEWTVVSDRKYVGNYSMRYITLSDPKINEGAYDASWFGMAVAYRDYLTEKGIISQLTAEELTSDIPLYIETFGAIETTEKILSIPVTVMAPLTTFDNVQTMYEELSKQGMNNINFKLTGYANGGMQYTMPGKLKFEKAVGGKKGFQELLDKANQVNKDEDKNFGVYPDFDFAYTMNSALFDGHRPAKHNAQTIDGRYASKKQYSPTQQKYENYYEMVVSPAYFSEFYEKLTKKFNKQYEGVIGISVSTLGNALNSDFDEDEPYNREDSKSFTIAAFQHFDQNYGQVMTDGGNAYVWKYVDHILGVALDSSRYNFASEAVPFLGVVLHGSIKFAGDPLNMEGSIEYAILKAIENGASPYFILSYQNTQTLKEDELLSKYYSIRYDIWKDDIVDSYAILNSVLGDVQDKYITNHQFVSGATRVPDSDELLSDILGIYGDIIDTQNSAAELLQKELEKAILIARENGRAAELYAAEAVIKVLELYTSQMKLLSDSALKDSQYYYNVLGAFADYYKVSSLKNSKVPSEKATYNRMKAIYDIVTSFNKDYESTKDTYLLEEAKYAVLEELGASYETEYKIFKDAYDRYAKGKLAGYLLQYEISSEIAADKLDNAIDSYAEGTITLDELVAAIEKYGVVLVGTGDVDEAIEKYLNGTLDTQVLNDLAKEWSTAVSKKGETDEEKAEIEAEKTATKKAFDDALEAYVNGTLSDVALNNAVTSWFAEIDENQKTLDELKTALESYKAGTITKKADIEAVIEAYCAAIKLDRTAIQNSVTALINSKNAYDKAEQNNTLDAISDADFNKANETYNAAKTAFDAAIAAFRSEYKTGDLKKAINTFEAAKTAFELATARKNVDKTDADSKFNAANAAYTAAVEAANGYVFVVSAIDEAVLAADIQDYTEKAEKYEQYVAASNALQASVDSGFIYNYDYCYAIYLEAAKADKYSAFGSLFKSGVDTSSEDYAKYMQYHEASVAVKALEAKVKASVPAQGKFDTFVKELAEYDCLKANKAELNLTDEELDKKASDVVKEKNKAINAVAKVDGAYLSQIEEIYETAMDYIALAESAIDILATAEKYTIVYEEGKDKHFTNIVMTGDMPFIVKQAIERLQNAYSSIYDDKIEVLEDGVLTDEYYEGHRLYRTRLSKTGRTVYFYGTYEDGYQYLEKLDDGSFVLYEKDKSKAGTVDGITVYENAQGDFGSKVYFMIVDGKMVYYTKTDEGVFIKKESIKYNGTEFTTLDDGTVIYKDGTTYYSVNADGTYTRYTYTQSAYNCYIEAVGQKDAVLDIVEALQNNADVSDNTVYDEIIGEINANKTPEKDEEEQEEPVEEDSKYATENVVAVTYGNNDGSAYKTVLLNYNNYTIRIEYEGIVYTISAYGFVEIRYEAE